jgi:tetratricopeptide (TPR) repeat protein
VAADALRPPRVPPLFGRSELIDQVALRLEETVAGRGGFLAVEGVAGVGKSRFLEAVVDRARALGFVTISGRSLPTDLPEPYALLRELLRATHSESFLSSTDRPSESDLVPIFLVPMSESPTATSEEPAREGERGDEADQLLTRLSDPGDRLRGERRGLHDRLIDYFRGLAATRPLLLALDDLHLADRSSMEFLANFLYAVPQERILVVASIAPRGELSVESASAIDQLLRGPSTSILSLRAMSESELGEYARWLLQGREPDPDALRRWYSQTEGNPLFVENVVRAWTGASGPASDPGGSDLRSLLERRIRDLTPVERRTLVYGAVLGREFDFEVLARASGAPEEEITEALDRLVHVGLLRERTGETYEFASERVRADTYGELTETRRGIIHRKVVQALETAHGGAAASVYDLARHAYLGRDDARSAHYNHRAADRAEESLAFDAAAAYLERAVESHRRLIPRDLSLELRLLVELGRALDEVGDLNRAEAVLEDAVVRARAGPVGDRDRAVALLGLARVRSDRTDLASAKTLATEAFQVLEKLGDERGVMAAHRVLGATSYRLGEMKEAEAHQRAELALAESHGTASEKGHALIDLANTFISLGPERLAEALPLYDQAASIFAERNDDAARARVLMNRGLLYHNAGKMAECLTDLLEAAKSAEKSQSKIWIGYTHLNLAQVYAELHNPTEAARSLEKALRLLEPQGDRLIVQSSRMIWGMIHEEQGSLDKAEGEYREAVELARELGLGPDASEGLYRAARLSERLGKRAQAQGWLREALDLGILRFRGDLAEGAVEFANSIDVPVLPAHR